MNNTLSKEDVLQKFAEESLGKTYYRDKDVEIGPFRYLSHDHEYVLKAMDEYAKQESRREAIEYRKWENDNFVYIDGVWYLFSDHKRHNPITDDKLYEQYIIHKQNNQ